MTGAIVMTSEGNAGMAGLAAEMGRLLLNEKLNGSRPGA